MVISQLLTALVLLTSVNTLASINVRGYVQKTTAGDYLLTESGSQKTYSLHFQSTIAKSQIERLTTGDFVSVTAETDNVLTSLIYITGVDYVGLASLIGAWTANNDLCYDFANFTTLYVYNPNRYGKCSRYIKSKFAQKYTYFINPDIDRWNLLISSATGEYVGELNIKNPRHIEIKLFDSQTDAILGDIILRR